MSRCGGVGEVLSCGWGGKSLWLVVGEVENYWGWVVGVVVSCCWVVAGVQLVVCAVVGVWGWW